MTNKLIDILKMIVYENSTREQRGGFESAFFASSLALDIFFFTNRSELKNSTDITLYEV
jgi:hypothetical protein